MNANEKEMETFYNNCKRNLEKLAAGNASCTRAVYSGVNNLTSPLKEQFTAQVAEQLYMTPETVMATAAAYAVPAPGGNKRR